MDDRRISFLKTAPRDGVAFLFCPLPAAEQAPPLPQNGVFGLSSVTVVMLLMFISDNES